ncbi:hypothetical protein BpHYR1_022436 [Brachionus plicatilis]|uniref:Uncharacterized protein n=1 Tax=Brachionus plicatilis TaxID=10195 RepID=A0A3M7RE31_BRAPC|nr:hypothetical protein BpHYR1_022436 [Brachionus plicatilis]
MALKRLKERTKFHSKLPGTDTFCRTSFRPKDKKLFKFKICAFNPDEAFIGEIAIDKIVTRDREKCL